MVSGTDREVEELYTVCWDEILDICGGWFRHWQKRKLIFESGMWGGMLPEVKFNTVEESIFCYIEKCNSTVREK